MAYTDRVEELRDIDDGTCAAHVHEAEGVLGGEELGQELQIGEKEKKGEERKLDKRGVNKKDIVGVGSHLSPGKDDEHAH